jgi:hypothetical protein
MLFRYSFTMLSCHSFAMLFHLVLLVPRAYVSSLHHREAHNYQNALTLHTSNAVLASPSCIASAECLRHSTIHTTIVTTVID